MEIMKIAALALIGVVLATLLRSAHKEIAIYVTLATVIVIFLSVANRLSEVFGFMENIYDRISYGRAFFSVIIKVLAVAYITDFTAQLCRDAGESAIGSKVELAGKIIIFYLAMPVLTAILEMIGTLLQ